MVDTLREPLRNRLRQQRRALSATAQQAAAGAFAERCLPLLDGASTIAMYLAIQGELSLAPILAHCRQRGVRTLLPIVSDDGLSFAVYDDSTTMVTGAFGIEAPDPDTARIVAAHEIDTVLVPLVGFDRQCQRLGMGGGYYDRCFAFRANKHAPPLLIGCAHDLQEVDSTLPDWWDVPLDHVVTDRRTLSRR